MFASSRRDKKCPAPQAENTRTPGIQGHKPKSPRAPGHWASSLGAKTFYPSATVGAQGTIWDHLRPFVIIWDHLAPIGTTKGLHLPTTTTET